MRAKVWNTSKARGKSEELGQWGRVIRADGPWEKYGEKYMAGPAETAYKHQGQWQNGVKGA